MKKLKLTLILGCLSFSTILSAQYNWGTSTIPTTTNGNVGIGTAANNTYKLSITTGNSTSFAQGIYVNNNYSGTSTKYGMRSNLTGGTGTKYGVYSYISNAGKNARYGVYSNALGSNAWAGYFKGRGYFSDKVGIGTNSPNESLHVKGKVLIDGAGAQLLFGKQTTSAIGEIGLSFSKSSDPDPHVPGLHISTPWGSAAGHNNFLMFINTDGNVGIDVKPSKIDPNFRLSVNGNIRATEITVETGWADFVFEDNYTLRSLNEVETFIDENGHLPEVPSAEEIQKNGAPVGEIQTILLQKIEELTLYAIAQQKLIDELTKKMANLESNH